MESLLLNGERKAEDSVDRSAGIIKQQLAKQGYQVNNIVLRQKEIADCRGCFDCWVKTPGVCIIDDFGRELAELLINSELVIYLSPVTFGGYSYQLKKAVDRLIPLITPFFKQKKGATHHKPRYDSYPSLLGVGIVTEQNRGTEKIFSQLIARNGINLCAPTYESILVTQGQSSSEIEKQIRQGLKRVGGADE